MGWGISVITYKITLFLSISLSCQLDDAKIILAVRPLGYITMCYNRRPTLPKRFATPKTRNLPTAPLSIVHASAIAPPIMSHFMWPLFLSCSLKFISFPAAATTELELELSGEVGMVATPLSG